MANVPTHQSGEPVTASGFYSAPNFGTFESPQLAGNIRTVLLVEGNTFPELEPGEKYFIRVYSSE